MTPHDRAEEQVVLGRTGRGWLDKNERACRMLRRMRATWLPVGPFAAAVTCVALNVRGVEITTLPPPHGTGIERGVAVLRCSTEVRGVYWESRGAVLDVAADNRADVVLTTGHGLPPGTEAVLRDCRAIARGKPYTVEAVWRTATVEDDWPHDWAVLLTHRLGNNIQRLRPGLLTPDGLARLVADRVPVRLVLRYGDEEDSDCRLEPSPFTQPPLVSHSCVGYPGVSGTPLIAMIGDEPLVIATQVGSQLAWDGSRFTMESVARVLDADVAAAIEAATVRARATVKHQAR